MNVYQRLNNARKQFHQLKLKKTGHNKFAGYYYFELGDFLIPALEVLAENGLCAVVSFDALIASMRVVDIETGATLTITSPMGSAALKGCHEVQNIGAVETYQRRYLWVAALEIVEHDALDSVTGSEQGKPQAKARPGQPTSGAWESISPDKQAELSEVALIVTEYAEAGDAVGCVDYLESKAYDAETKVALWTQLGSKVRTAIKKEHEARRQAA
jgi:hypothetical protein